MPTPSFAVAPFTPSPLLSALKEALTHACGDGSLIGLSGSVPGGMVGVPWTGALAGPGPIAFWARMTTVYSRSFERFVRVQVPAGAPHGHQVTALSTLIS